MVGVTHLCRQNTLDNIIASHQHGKEASHSFLSHQCWITAVSPQCVNSFVTCVLPASLALTVLRITTIWGRGSCRKPVKTIGIGLVTYLYVFHLSRDVLSHLLPQNLKFHNFLNVCYYNNFGFPPPILFFINKLR